MRILTRVTLESWAAFCLNFTSDKLGLNSESNTLLADWLLPFQIKFNHPFLNVKSADFITQLDDTDLFFELPFCIRHLTASVTASSLAFVFANAKSTLYIMHLSGDVPTCRMRNARQLGIMCTVRISVVQLC